MKGKLGDRPAFPAVKRVTWSGGTVERTEGMSTRTLLAAAVVAGNIPMPPWKRPNPDNGPSPDVAYGRDVVRIVDAVLAELERDDDPPSS